MQKIISDFFRQISEFCRKGVVRPHHSEASCDNPPTLAVSLRICRPKRAGSSLPTFASSAFSTAEYPRLFEIVIAAFFASAAKAGTFSRVTRVVGPETLRAAAIFPEDSKIGAPIQRDPR